MKLPQSPNNVIGDADFDFVWKSVRCEQNQMRFLAYAKDLLHNLFEKLRNRKKLADFPEISKKPASSRQFLGEFSYFPAKSPRFSCSCSPKSRILLGISQGFWGKSRFRADKPASLSVYPRPEAFWYPERWELRRIWAIFLEKSRKLLEFSENPLRKMKFSKELGVFASICSALREIKEIRGKVLQNEPFFDVLGSFQAFLQLFVEE